MVEAFIRATEVWADARVQIAISYDEALAAFAAQPFDIAFFDYRLGARDGLSLLREIRQKGIETPVVVLTSLGAEDVAVEAMKTGAADYLSKANLTIEGLERTIRHALALHAEEVQRWQVEAALRASEERFRALVENSSDALLLIDAEGRVKYMTPSSVRHLGWAPEQLMGRSVFDFMHPDDADRVGARIRGAVDLPGASLAGEVRFHHADGTWRIMEGVGVNRLGDPAVGGIVVNIRDITERRKLEEQLRQAQKMEAVGQLAGGVAHDFNNLLTAILGYCHLMLDEVAAEDPLRLDLLEMQAAGDRAAARTRQLLAFSRRQMLQPQVVDINTLVTQLEKLLRRLIAEDVVLVTALSPDLRQVTVDPASLEQILVNLAVNARDAMPPRGGSIRIETSNVPRRRCDRADAGQAGPYVRLTVSDTGVGTPTLSGRASSSRSSRRKSRARARGSGSPPSTASSRRPTATSRSTASSDTGRRSRFTCPPSQAPRPPPRRPTEWTKPRSRGAASCWSSKTRTRSGHWPSRCWSASDTGCSRRATRRKGR
jgi:PAS domain S-box-containing protein